MNILVSACQSIVKEVAELKAENKKLQARNKCLKRDKTRVKADNRELLKLTEQLDEHPEGYDGPCFCKMCVGYNSG
jgi:cell shape-determining protein MreC